MGQPTRDQALEFRVSKFLQSRHFPGFDELNVQVEEGCVYITGQLNSYYEKQVAINSCRRVAGVANLIDQIEIVEFADVESTDTLANAS